MRRARAARFAPLVILLVALLVSCASGRRLHAPPVEAPAGGGVGGPADVAERPEPGRGAWHVVEAGQTLWRIARTYGVPLETLVEVNGIADPARLEIGQRLFIPGVRRPVEVEPPSSPPGGGPGPAPEERAGWSWPVEGPITSRFGALRSGGRRHQGIDIDLESGEPIRAARSGRVVFAGKRGDFGLLVVIEHERGLSSWYAHCRRLFVKPGDQVERGAVIARGGRTGRATGSHLHFEIRRRGVPLDPVSFLP